MAKRLIYVGQDDDVSDLAGKMQAADPGDEVAMVVPAGAQAFQSPLNVRLLRSVAARRGLSTSVVTPDPRIQELARGVGVSAFSSVAAYEGGVPVTVRPNGPAPYRGTVPPPRPQAPFLPRAPGPPGPATALAAPPGTAPVAPQSPWAPPPGRAPLGPAAAPPPLAPGPRTGGTWAPLPEPAAWEEPPPPWEAARSRAAFQSGVAETGQAAQRPAPPSGPPGRRPLQGPLLGPPPGRFRALLRNRTALTFTAIGLVVILLVAFLVFSPSATVTVTIAEQPLTVNPTIQGTATPSQASQPNFVLGKVVSDTTSQTFPVNPSGTQTVPAVAATGSVVLTGDSAVCSTGYFIGPGELLFETTAGIQFSAPNTTGFTIQEPSCTSTVAVTAVAGGSQGIVPAAAISIWLNTPCTGGGACAPGSITVANPAQTTGGANATTQAIASASDVATWQAQLNQVETQLGDTATNDLNAKAGQDKPAVDPNGDGKSVTFAVAPTSFTSVAAGTVMNAETITVTMTAQETVYDPAAVQADVLADLQKSTNLPSGDTLIPSQLTLKKVQVIQSGSDGTFALSVEGVDYYHPQVSLGQIDTQLTGHNPSDVFGIIQQQIPDVRSVDVHVTPVQLFYMPFFSSHIKIVETFVTPGNAS
ncbi:MAG: hypothetical protein ACLQT7_03355 [Candidatus Dormibacteria bacterium]